MTIGMFMVIEILLMCGLSFLMGFMVGANKGSADTTKIWQEEYKKMSESR